MWMHVGISSGPFHAASIKIKAFSSGATQEPQNFCVGIKHSSVDVEGNVAYFKLIKRPTEPWLIAIDDRLNEI